MNTVNCSNMCQHLWRLRKLDNAYACMYAGMMNVFCSARTAEPHEFKVLLIPLILVSQMTLGWTVRTLDIWFSTYFLWVKKWSWFQDIFIDASDGVTSSALLSGSNRAFPSPSSNCCFNSGFKHWQSKWRLIQWRVKQKHKFAFMIPFMFKKPMSVACKHKLVLLILAPV